MNNRSTSRTITVIIPYGGKGANLLIEQLHAVDASASHAQKRLGVVSEIVLAVNAKEAHEKISLEIATLHLKTSITVVDASALRGPSYARNEGVANSRGGLLLFCDADDIVSEGWVVEMFQALKEYDIAGGSLDLTTLNPGAYQSNRGKAHTPRHDWGWLLSTPTSNLAVSRETFQSVDGFDPLLRLGEDKDFCWRAQYAGAKFGVADSAVVSYRWRPNLKQHFSQTYSWGVGDAILVKQHRRHGLKPEYLNGSLRTARAFLYVATVPVLYSRRWHAVGAFGKALGRIVGSLRHRVWAL